LLIKLFFKSHFFREDEVLLKAFELGDCSNFYEQSLKEMINNSVIAENIDHLEKLIAIKDDNSK
jgi:hypothetical protein